MSPIIFYCLKVILCSTILYGYYWFILRNKIYHRYNRFYLLSVMLLSITLPLIKFTIGATEQANTGIIKLLTTVNGNGEYLDEVVIYSGRNSFTWKSAAIIFFVLVSLAILVSLVNALVHIYRLKKNNPLQEIENIKLIKTCDKSTPFSFFKNIFWNELINIDTENGQRILKHELAHVTEHHSVDKLAINILLILFWWNPIFWLLRKELNLIHEFIADKKAVEDGDTAAFAEMILAATYPRHQFNITNNFFYSPIKRRLAMLQKKNKASIGYISRILVLPLAALVFLAFTINAKNTIAEIKLDKKIVVVIDAGHGGTDAGAVGLDGSKEKDISLQLALKVQALNTNKNIEIILTRITDLYQSPKEKAEFANSKNTDVFISIHLESSLRSLPPKSGMSVFIAKNGYENVEESKILASAALQSFKNNYGIAVPDTIAQRQVGIWVLQASKAPAILIEAGFIDNKKDIGLMKSEAGQTQFAKNVLNAIEMYAANKESVFYKNEPMPEVVAMTSIKTGDGSVNGESGVPDFKLDKRDNEQLKKVLIIINGQEVSYNKINWKYVKAKKGSFYQENNPIMIAKYGAKAKYGVWMFDDAEIKNSGTVGDNRSYNFATDSVYFVSASQTQEGTDKFSSYIVRVGDHIGIALSGEGEYQQNYVVATDGTIFPAGLGKINVAGLTFNQAREILKSRFSKVVPKGTKISVSIGDSRENMKEMKIEDANAEYVIISVDSKHLENNIISVDSKHFENNMQGTIPNKVFIKVDQEASFPGGQDAWRRYLQTNLNANVPIDAGMKTGTYTVLVHFIVNSDGSLQDIVTKNYVGTKMAEECLRVIKKGPKWIPARQNKRVVNSYKTQPITFVVQE